VDRPPPQGAPPRTSRAVGMIVWVNSFSSTGQNTCGSKIAPRNARCRLSWTMRPAG
jgi:hypothetical protein